MFNLNGKHALVTGATGPLQRALAVALAEAGADVSLTTTSAEMAEEVQANSILNECWSVGRKGEAITLNLADASAVDDAVAGLEERIGPISILVNASHTAAVKPFLDVSAEDIGDAFNANVAATLNATRAAGARMLERGQGRVINILSILGDRGVPNCALYSATQGAILGFTKSLGIEWIRQGVTVNALGIGFYEDVPGPQQDPALREVLERYIPMRRLGQAKDLQGAVVYLASDEAAFVDSEVVVVDGAISVHA